MAVLVTSRASPGRGVASVIRPCEVRTAMKLRHLASLVDVPIVYFPVCSGTSRQTPCPLASRRPGALGSYEMQGARNDRPTKYRQGLEKLRFRAVEKASKTSQSLFQFTKIAFQGKSHQYPGKSTKAAQTVDTQLKVSRACIDKPI